MKAGQPAVTGEIENKINAAVGYLRENFTEEISRENLAATLDLHPDSFSRYFPDAHGQEIQRVPERPARGRGRPPSGTD
jgi:transcriptional regulator GlxA family with amidase domain